MCAILPQRRRGDKVKDDVPPHMQSAMCCPNQQSNATNAGSIHPIKCTAPLGCAVFNRLRRVAKTTARETENEPAINHDIGSYELRLFLCVKVGQYHQHEGRTQWFAPTNTRILCYFCTAPIFGCSLLVTRFGVGFCVTSNEILVPPKPKFFNNTLRRSA